MSDLQEARKNLEAVLGEDLLKQYFILLKKWLMFSEPLTNTQFYGAVRKLFKNDEQIVCHDLYILALASKVNSTRTKKVQTSDDGFYEMADFTEYLSPSSPSMIPPNIVHRSAASEFFLPDNRFISTRIEIHAWENGLDGAHANVSDYVVMLCQMFVKNILTAMISRKESYKVRDGHFQYGFGFPVPDPTIRNANNVIDYSQESKVDVMDDDDSFVPKMKPTLEDIEQQTAFAYSCSKRGNSNDKLTVKLLYDTLRANPQIIGLHSIHSPNLLKIGLELDES
ncbi:PREDICTED: transcriptional adapter 1-like [Nicrophorus vespilloides]|uniref:Transcriptional adapter 1-like n=1 Tax=Nicrophorus vespilloides TaxID=110193 RepID=A0ABM1MW91_NICVS|nr:PREDICTED: transcriptional adapter 1-like [Nicrophorus vespilloides]